MCRPQTLVRLFWRRDLPLRREEDRVEPAGVEVHRSVVAPAARVRRGDLVVRVAEDALVRVAEGLAGDGVAVVDLVREVDVGDREDRLVRQGGVEDVGQAGRDRVGAVLPADRRRVGHLALAVPPPQADDEGLGLALDVVAQEHLGVVRDVEVEAREPLPAVLVDEEVVDVVVAAGRGRVGVRVREEVQHRPAAGIDPVGRHDPAGEVGRGVDEAAAADRARVAEVAVAHRRGGDPGLDVARVEGLAEVLEAGEEEDLVAVLVEAGARDEERAAHREAGVDELVLDPLGPDLVGEPLVRVQAVVAQVRRRPSRGTRGRPTC